MSEKKPQRAFVSGLYIGFVEWRAPPEGQSKRHEWKIGFLAGWVLKVAAFMLLGAKFVPI